MIITGAASGIGAGTAQALRKRGAQVVGLDLNPGEDTIACDVTDQKSVDRAMSEAVERLGGGVDALVNCAGIGLPQSAVLPPRPRRPARPRRQPARHLAGDRLGAAGAARQPRSRRQRLLRARPPRRPLRHRLRRQQARGGWLLGAVALRGRRRDHSHHRLPRLHPHPDPRRQPERRHGARGDGAAGADRRRGRDHRPRHLRPAGARPRDHPPRRDVLPRPPPSPQRPG